MLKPESYRAVDTVGATRRRRGVAGYRSLTVTTNVPSTPHATLLTTNSICYVWGLDLSGTPQGAGGVGGLLAVIDDNANTYMPVYDANGNVTEYVDSSDTTVAHYAYDAYGNTINQSGLLADDFKFRFSTKYWDYETWLYDYIKRYYAPRLGRFISTDPIGERGDLNLYGFCGNAPINRWDYLGLKCQLFLTFDDGPYPGTDDVLKHLKAATVKATFFVNVDHAFPSGRKSEWRIDLLRQILDEGHLLGNHGAIHDYKLYASPSLMAENFNDNIERLEKILGKKIPSLRKYGRMPGGSTWYLGDEDKLSGPGKISSFNPEQTRRSAEALIAAGYLLFGWDIEWKPGTTAKDMANKTWDAFKNGEGKKPGKLILLAHDIDFRESLKGNRLKLEEYIEELKKCCKDVSFHTLENY